MITKHEKKGFAQTARHTFTSTVRDVLRFQTFVNRKPGSQATGDRCDVSLGAGLTSVCVDTESINTGAVATYRPFYGTYLHRKQQLTVKFLISHH
jgi:hypothetical protein